jgi:hypothetical protein
MSWSKFTLDNYKQFKKYIYKLSDDNKLLKSIRQERFNIIKFIKNNVFTHRVTQLYNVLEPVIKQYAIGTFVQREDIINKLNEIPDEYLIKWGDNKIHIKTTQDKFNSISKRLPIIISMLEYIKNLSNCKHRIFDIYLILSPLEKMKPDTDYIQVPSVNTGYTDFYKNIIFIWRYEEFDKVLFHEVLHFVDLDNREHNYPHTYKLNIDDGTNSPMEERLYEAYTDFFAIYYHLIYLSIITKVKIKKLLELELTFICNQAQRVNTHFKLGDWSIIPNGIIKQGTSAFSYYILKYMIFEYMLNNNINELKNFKIVLNKIFNNGFKSKVYIDIPSFRMTLFQLL